MFDTLKKDLYEALKKLTIFTSKLDDFTKKMEKTAEVVDKLSERVVALEAGREAFKQQTLREFDAKIFDITTQVREKQVEMENKIRQLEMLIARSNSIPTQHSQAPLAIGHVEEDGTP